MPGSVATRSLVELIDHGIPLDPTANDALAELAADHGLRLVATNNVHYATPGGAGWPPRSPRSGPGAAWPRWTAGCPRPGAHLRSGAEMARLFARYPGAVARTVAVADECAFDLQLAKPRLPKQRVPPGTPRSAGCASCAAAGPTSATRTPGGSRGAPARRELAVIEEKDFPGYFLIVHDMVDYARGRGILCQGRGSAANSVVCYVLGITAVDPILYDLPFERFLPPPGRRSPTSTSTSTPTGARR